ncbi:amidohydrolase [uncultured Shewanella sp.]|uniref:amidohydrolase n=1 Tax=uncultured Shewanella sp. TaxID=173975 RepID=UPI002602E2FB|nr:amidohydrolase family protein [uncultured Shewanella sp.]
MFRIIGTIALVAALSACSQDEPKTLRNNPQADVVKQEIEPKPYQLQQTLFFGGDILTMVGDKPQYVEAVVEREGKIVFTGRQAEAFKRFEGKAEQYDLKGNTLMPGFIEPHLHPSIAALMLPNEVIAPHDWVLPDGVKEGVQTPDAYIKRLSQSIKDNAKSDKMFFVWGYHQLWHGKLNRETLNKLSPDKPVAVIHRSFHEIFLNDKAIEMFGIKESDFSGNPQVDWKNGHFYEGGWLALVPKISHILVDPESYKAGLAKMTQLIRKNGITTIAEPGFPSSDFKMEYDLLKQEMDKNPPYDVYLIPNGTQLYAMAGNDNHKAMEVMETLPELYNTDNIKFLPKQVKLFADGAIYSLLMQMQEGYPDGHKGEWMTPLPLFKEQLSLYWQSDYKIHVHSNGDLGIQQVLDYNAEDQQRTPKKDHRLTLHHMGYFTDKQADEIAGLGIEASVNPFYLWALADKYATDGLGAERAGSLVRVKSLTDRGVPVSFHSDFAMAPVEPLTLAWTAINRVTANNSLLSQEQRIDAYTAMKAITSTAARTLSLEKIIGTIEEGKTANFTILKENPLKVEPMDIKDIAILGTVFHGETLVNKVNNLQR